MKNAFFDTLATITKHPLFLPLLAVAALLVMALTVAPQSLLAMPFAGSLLEEGRRTADFMVSEAPGKLSRDNITVTVPADTTYSPGQVIGTLAADGNYVPYDPTGSDGSETATGILYASVINDTDGELELAGVVINLNAEVRRAGLVWADGLTDEQKADAEEDLMALGIKVREL